MAEEYLDLITRIATGLTEFADSSQGVVYSVIDGEVSQVEKTLDSTITTLITPIEKAVTKVEDTSTKEKDTIIDALFKGIGSITDTLLGLVSKPVQMIKSGVSDILAVLEPLVRAISATFAPLIETVTSTFGKLAENVKTWIGDRVSELVSIVDGLYTTFAGSLAWLGSEIGKGLSDAIDKLIPKFDSVTTIVESTATKVEQSGILQFLKRISVSLHNALDGLEKLDIEGATESSPYLPQEVVRIFAAVGAITGAPLGFFPFFGDIFEAGVGEILRHDAMETYRPTLLPAPTAIEAKYRELISPELMTSHLARQGFNTRNIEVLNKLYLKLLDIDTLRLLYLRKEINEARLVSEMAKWGYQFEDIEQIKKLFLFIPGVQDLIRMAVREAFSPEIAEKFGQYQDFPAQLGEWGAKQGLSEDWAKAYWASHWDLPGANMGFEMLHRGIITEDELRLLLRALDVMPFWRDKLIQLSYIPFTRVDVRRMHKMGIITDEELVTSYMDIGYAPDKAAKLAEFTIIYNREPEANEQTAADTRKAKDKDLTKGDILKGYHDSLLPVEVARQSLLDIGYSQEEMEYYVNREDFLIEQEIVNTHLNNLHSAYVKGTIAYNQLVDLLGQLNLPTSQVESLLSLWGIEKSLKAAKPTKSELLGWWKKKLITADDCHNELASLGYADQYIKLYMSAPSKSEGD